MDGQKESKGELTLGRKKMDECRIDNDKGA
jgi:hypothetical protein